MLRWFRKKKSIDSVRLSNEAWISMLSEGPEKERALQELRVLLVKGLQAGLRNWGAVKAEAYIEDFAQEALLKILENLDSFDGRSRFITWTNKIAINLAISELRRKQWQNISLSDVLVMEDQEVPLDPFPSQTLAPDSELEQNMLAAMIERMMMEELTERQRDALMAVMKGMPMSEVAARMDTNRNALYKLLHDARMKMKERMMKEGLSPEDM